MPLPAFQFDLRVDAGGEAEALSDTVASEVLRQAGYAPQAGDELRAAIAAAVRETCARGPCTVSFRSDTAALEVVVTGGTDARRRIARPLPG